MEKNSYCVRPLSRRVRRREVSATVVVLALALVIILSWPVASWLQCREMRITDGIVPDAIYVAAGSHDQDRRIGGVLLFLGAKDGVRMRGEGEQRGRANDSMEILAGNDTLKGGWSSEDQRNLMRGEWAVKKLERNPSVRRMQESGLVTVGIVPGRFDSTDGEMASLAGYLGDRPAIQTLALATSPFHLRRATWRLQKHMHRDLTIVAVKIRPEWRDRMPWTVALELAKLTRDALLK